MFLSFIFVFTFIFIVVTFLIRFVILVINVNGHILVIFASTQIRAFRVCSVCLSNNCISPADSHPCNHTKADQGPHQELVDMSSIEFQSSLSSFSHFPTMVFNTWIDRVAFKSSPPNCTLIIGMQHMLLQRI